MDKKIKMTSAILDAFEDGIYVMNQDLVVEYMNGAMVAEFGAILDADTVIAQRQGIGEGLTQFFR